MISDFAGDDWTGGDSGGDDTLDNDAYTNDLNDLPENPDLVDSSDDSAEALAAWADLPESPDLLAGEDDSLISDSVDNPTDNPDEALAAWANLPENPDLLDGADDPLPPAETPPDIDPAVHAGDNNPETGPNTPEGESLEERPVMEGRPTTPEGWRPGGIEGRW